MNDAIAEHIKASRKGAVAIVTIDYPKRRNALSLNGREQLLACLGELVADSTVRALVLTGAGNTFCAGADVSEMSQGEGNTLLERRNLVGIHTHRILRHIFQGPKPVVAAVEGSAFGAGFSLAVASDYVVAAENARFCAAQTRVGLMPDVGLIWTLKERVGPAAAREILMLVREIGGTEAGRMGIANKVVEAGAALEAAIGIAEQFAAGAPLSLSLLKKALSAGSNSFEDALRTETDYLSILMLSKDHREAVAAFKEKRSPSFIGE